MIVLEAGEARAEVALEGAELKRWTIAGRPLLWTPEPAIWPETAPILFPVVGWTRHGQARVGPITYPLGLHGFARHRPFTVAAQDKREVCLQLSSDAESLALYPFAFKLSVTHRLSETGWCATIDVENTGDAPMPYACGVHPGFRWPFAGGEAESYRIRFAVPEDPQVPEIAAGGFISQRKKTLPLAGTILPLANTLFENDALCFLNAKSTKSTKSAKGEGPSLWFEAPDGAAISLAIEDFPHLALWCRPGAGFLCLEAWTGYSDPETFEGDLYDKPSMRLLQPGSSARHAATYTFEA